MDMSVACDLPSQGAPERPISDGAHRQSLSIKPDEFCLTINPDHFFVTFPLNKYIILHAKSASQTTGAFPEKLLCGNFLPAAAYCPVTAHEAGDAGLAEGSENRSHERPGTDLGHAGPPGRRKGV